jgi:hypothetical protein
MGGHHPAATHLCIVGGTLIGQQPRSLTWPQMKHQPGYDGDGLRINGAGWYVVDGLRVDNVEDGISPFGDGFVGRNLYFTYIRDDCIENDAISGGYVSDSLFDGCLHGPVGAPEQGLLARAAAQARRSRWTVCSCGCSPCRRPMLRTGSVTGSCSSGPGGPTTQCCGTRSSWSSVLRSTGLARCGFLRARSRGTLRWCGAAPAAIRRPSPGARVTKDRGSGTGLAAPGSPATATPPGSPWPRAGGGWPRRSARPGRAPECRRRACAPSRPADRRAPRTALAAPRRG